MTRPEMADAPEQLAASTEQTLAERIGRAMSDANKSHILSHQREMSLRELGEVAAREAALALARGEHS